MAEVVEGVKNAHEIPSMAKANAALTTGIIGTSLSGLLTLGALGIGTGVIGGNKGGGHVPCGDLYNERKEQADYVELTKQFYEGQIATQKAIDKNFFDLYKMNVAERFLLRKNNPVRTVNDGSTCRTHRKKDY